MNLQKKNLLRSTLTLLILSALSAGLIPNAFLTAAAESAHLGSVTLSPALSARLSRLASDADAGMVIVAFRSSNGLRDEHLNVLRSVGVTGGQTFPTLGMVAQPRTAG